MKAKTDLPTSAELSRRLWIVTELRNLCLSLGRAKRACDIAGIIQKQRTVYLSDVTTG